MKLLFTITLSSIYFLSLTFGFPIVESYLNDQEIRAVQGITAFPVELSIDRLGIRAPIEPVGVLNNTMAVPSNGERVGWYDQGPRPGDKGSSVLAGHVNWSKGQDAVFTNLHTLQIGDTVQVRNSNDERNVFTVVRIASYPMDANTAEVFLSQNDRERLNLITCDGVWDSGLNTHRSRLVVFTEKI